MNFKTTIALLVLLAVAGVYFLVIERSATTSFDRAARRQQGAEAPGEPVFTDPDLTAAGIDALEIERAGTVARFERTPGGWAQTRPVRFPVSASQVEAAIVAALGLSRLDRFEPGQGDAPTLADVGLEPPRLTLRLLGPDQPVTLQLGRRSLAGQGYARIGRPTPDAPASVSVVTGRLHELLLDAQPADWRTRTFQLPPLGQLTALTLDRPGDTIRLTRGPDQWRLGPDADQRADDNAVAALVGALRGARIDAFADDAPEDPAFYGLAPARATLRIERSALESAQPASDTPPAELVGVLRLGKPADLDAGSTFATWSTTADASPVVFTLPADAADRLTPGRDELRDPRIVLTEPAGVSRLAVERDGGPDYTLVRDPDAGFAFADAGPGFEADYEAARSLLESLAEARAEAYTTELSPLGEPRATVTLTPRATSTPERVRLYAGPEPDTLWAVRNDEPVAARVAAQGLGPVLDEPLVVLRQRTLASAGDPAVTRIEIDQSGGPSLVLTRDPDAPADSADADAAARWELRGDAALDGPAAAELLPALTPLRVEAWQPGAAPPDSPGLRLRLLGEAGPLASLAIDPETRLAAVEGVATPVRIGDALVAALTAELRDRTVLSLARPSITAVTVAQAEEQVTVRRDEGGAFVDAEGEPVDDAAAAALYDLASSLRADRWADVPAGDPALTVSIELDAGDAVELSVFTGPEPPVVVKGGRAYAVDPSVLQTLRAVLPGAEDDPADAAMTK